MYESPALYNLRLFYRAIKKHYLRMRELYYCATLLLSVLLATMLYADMVGSSQPPHHCTYHTVIE